MAMASSSTSFRPVPPLLTSPLILTCIHTCSAGKFAGRCSDKRSAIFSLSMLCTQAKFSAMARVLLLWIGPM